MKVIKGLWGIALIGVLPFGGCGSENGAGTGVSNPPSISSLPQSAAAASAGAVLGNSDAISRLEASQPRFLLALMNQIVRQAHAIQSCPSDPGCTCDQARKEKVDQFGVQMRASGAAGAYGSENEPITVTTADFCTLSDGTANTGSGPDGKGKFASFALMRDLNGSCQSDFNEVKVSLGTGSKGIWRITEQEGNTPVHNPEVYFNLLFVSGGASHTLDCTLFLSEVNDILFADCEKAGVFQDQDLTATCQF